MFCFVNGEWCRQGLIAVDDRGFTLADGVFETILITQRQPKFLTQHLQRLFLAAASCQIIPPYSLSQLESLISEILVLNDLDKAVLKIILSGGSTERGLTAKRTQPSLVMSLHPFSSGKLAINATISSIRRNETSPLATIKSLNYLDNIFARQQAIDAGFDDAIFLNTQGFLTCATSSNIFLVAGDVLMTPPLSAGVLNGVTRQVIMSLAKEHGLLVLEQNILLDQIKDFSEMFLCNSVQGIVSVKTLDQVLFFNDEMTQQLRQWYLTKLNETQ